MNVSREIFLIKENGSLVKLRERVYDSEDLLQELSAKYPNILAGDQINRQVPRKWLRSIGHFINGQFVGKLPA